MSFSNTNHDVQEKKVSQIALPLGLLIWMPLYLYWATGKMHPQSRLRTLLRWLGLPSFFSTFGAALAISSVTSYLSLSLMEGVLIIVALRSEEPSRFSRLMLMLLLVAIVLFPWVFRYKLALRAASSFKVLHPTRPRLLSGPVKMAQVIVEWRRCSYSLLGWDERECLYYESICGKRRKRWVVCPQKGEQAQAIAVVPEDLREGHQPDACKAWEDLSLVFPKVKPEYLHVFISESKVSPSGRWLAVVLHHPYGPEDVILLSKSTD